ncbi:hypothetical protein EYZ11_010543 [Aspergillus tanneri]|uniref:Uncharacterized protein n=1 Tax=Aspergillus tanneri TaxID=1220188 RepID=A0A4S3J785_9EURO|nr:hypothetical protein EYZ11_010543 [Aspergillus tanneri]
MYDTRGQEPCLYYIVKRVRSDEPFYIEKGQESCE